MKKVGSELPYSTLKRVSLLDSVISSASNVPSIHGNAFGLDSSSGFNLPGGNRDFKSFKDSCMKSFNATDKEITTTLPPVSEFNFVPIDLENEIEFSNELVSKEMPLNLMPSRQASWDNAPTILTKAAMRRRSFSPTPTDNLELKNSFIQDRTSTSSSFDTRKKSYVPSTTFSQFLWI